MEVIGNRIEKVVTEEMTAKAMGSGSLPVLATPAMIALIEETCWKSVAGGFGEGKSTVGIKIDVKHVSATSVGKKIWCESEILEEDTKHVVFSFKVYDEAGLIGEGTHERYIIDEGEFMKKAEEK